MPPTRYEITVEGHLDQSHWSRWFEGMEVILTPDGKTTIWGPVADQSALHGLLAKIRDLGLPLIALQRVEIESRIHDCQPDASPTSETSKETLIELA